MTTALVTVAVAGTLVAACSSSGSTAASSPDPAFAQKGNAICSRYNDTLGPLGAKAALSFQSGDTAAAISAVDQEAELLGREVDELDALHGTDSQETNLGKALDLTRHQVELAKQIADALRKNDLDAAGKAVDQSNGLNAPADAAFRAAGLDGCTLESHTG
ncbi:MAG TPA: hypothetical protein VHA73_13985 [Acidimicrobiales bacterium]|jgi:hypothetical protein|nr:hypothetical protein [Acidimicrobiales bacterium]